MMQGKTKKPGSISQNLESSWALQAAPRPQKGWIRAIREAAGISAGELGRILGVSRQLPLQFEKAEADDTITLKSLRNVANALGCDLVYALVPRPGGVRHEHGGHEQGRKRGHGPIESAVRANHAAGEASESTEPEATGVEVESQDLYFCD